MHACKYKILHSSFHMYMHVHIAAVSKHKPHHPSKLGERECGFVVLSKGYLSTTNLKNETTDTD